MLLGKIKFYNLYFHFIAFRQLTLVKRIVTNTVIHSNTIKLQSVFPAQLSYSTKSDDEDFLSSSEFSKIAANIPVRSSGQYFKWCNRHFQTSFRVYSYLCSLIWALLSPEGVENSWPSHFLWFLIFLNMYYNEHVHSNLANADDINRFENVFGYLLNFIITQIW